MNKIIIEKELQEIEILIEKLAILKEGIIEPTPSVVVKKGNGIFQYYYRDEQGEMKYIPAKNRRYARDLIQNDYYNKVMEKLLEQKRLLNHFIKKYEENPVEMIYEKCCKGRQVLIEPLIPVMDVYVNNWMEKHPGSQNPFEKKGTYLTNRGEYVRSKSEKILADMFYKYKIPYQYEAKVELVNGKVCYPDFILLNVRERKTYYWEHFGLASEKEYSDKNLDKICRYEQSGIVLGENLLISIESIGVQLDVKMIEGRIKKYLC